MYIKRDLEAILKNYVKFPAIALLGPRQSGKTTLAKHYFPNHRYLSFEDPAIREFAASDPRGFLKGHENSHGLILDEFQYIPEILSYIQLEADEKDRPGYFILTGSQNFLMNASITQSLAGRVGILTLLPFSVHELQEGSILPSDYPEVIIKGFYPRVYAKDIAPADLYPSYINTYVERDVRQLINVTDLNTFQKFLALCAGRIGQLLNLTEIAMQCGISAPTAGKWLSILEASYIVFRLQPHFVNYNKRIIKTPKLYFYDTGLACSLLQIHSTDILTLNPFRGPLFENLIISDFYKQYHNKGQRPPLYFWRNNNGLIEVDCLADLGHKLVPIEIKAGNTISGSFFTGIAKFNELSHTNPEDNYIIYGGSNKQSRSGGHVIGWKDAAHLIHKL